MRRHAAIFTLGCVFLAGCQSAHSTPAPTAKPVTVTVTTTATRTVTVSVTPSVSERGLDDHGATDAGGRWIAGG